LWNLVWKWTKHDTWHVVDPLPPQWVIWWHCRDPPSKVPRIIWMEPFFNFFFETSSQFFSIRRSNLETKMSIILSWTFDTRTYLNRKFVGRTIEISNIFFIFEVWFFIPLTLDCHTLTAKQSSYPRKTQCLSLFLSLTHPHSLPLFLCHSLFLSHIPIYLFLPHSLSITHTHKFALINFTTPMFC